MSVSSGEQLASSPSVFVGDSEITESLRSLFEQLSRIPGTWELVATKGWIVLEVSRALVRA